MFAYPVGRVYDKYGETFGVCVWKRSSFLGSRLLFLSGQKNFAFITWAQSYCEGLDILWCWIPCRVIDKMRCVKLASEGYW